MSRYQFREWDSGGVRTVQRTQGRILDAFLTDKNTRRIRRGLAKQLPAGPLLRFVTEGLADTMRRFGLGLARDVVTSDPLATRGIAGPVSERQELARINAAFVQSRVDSARDNHKLIMHGRSDQSYQMQMFTADSLRPPGFESLNDPEPWHALLERRRPNKGEEMPAMTPGVDEADQAWEAGNPDRTAAEAMEAYWGEGAVATGPSAARKPQNSCHTKPHPEPTRRQRIEGIPRWQHTSNALDGTDRDIQGELGREPIEMKSQVRRWGNAATRRYLARNYVGRRHGPTL
jgi:hypothetical protein